MTRNFSWNFHFAGRPLLALLLAQGRGSAGGLQIISNFGAQWIWNGKNIESRRGVATPQLSPSVEKLENPTPSLSPYPNEKKHVTSKQPVFHYRNKGLTRPPASWPRRKQRTYTPPNLPNLRFFSPFSTPKYAFSHRGTTEIPTRPQSPFPPKRVCIWKQPNDACRR